MASPNGIRHIALDEPTIRTSILMSNRAALIAQILRRLAIRRRWRADSSPHGIAVTDIQHSPLAAWVGWHVSSMRPLAQIALQHSCEITLPTRSQIETANQPEFGDYIWPVPVDDLQCGGFSGVPSRQYRNAKPKLT